MQGLELSQKYFYTFGEPMLKEQFPDLLPLLSAGLFGSGSECFGFDDDISHDHDFEPGFCLFLPSENVIDRPTAFRLERAVAKLPKEFMGFRRSWTDPVGGSRHGVFRTADFFKDKVGSSDGVLTVSEWLSLPEQSLAEATNGRIFFDNYGEVNRIRSSLFYFPEDIRLKKLAGHLLLAAQAGQYNYMRCVKRNERSAAQLAAFEFVKHAMSVIFLLNRRYQPYYKWTFRALRCLEKLSLHAELFDYLLTTDNEDTMAEEKYNTMEGIAADLIDELIAQGLTKANCGDLEKHAYSVNDGIGDPTLRNSHILTAV